MDHKSIVFLVSDMHCQSCPKLIALDLEDQKGVISVTATLETHTVNVKYDPAITNPESLAQTIKNSGYTPQLKEVLN